MKQNFSLVSLTLLLPTPFQLNSLISRLHHGNKGTADCLRGQSKEELGSPDCTHFLITPCGCPITQKPCPNSKRQRYLLPRAGRFPFAASGLQHNSTVLPRSAPPDYIPEEISSSGNEVNKQIGASEKAPELLRHNPSAENELGS